MTPIIFPNGAPVLVIDDMYTDTELTSIWEELAFLTSSKRLHNAEKVGAAVGEDGELKKNANGVFLDEFYTQRSSSNILEINRKLFADQIIEYALQVSIFYGLLRNVNYDMTLINYYDNAQTYKVHHDHSAFSAITMFYKEPAHFAGGDLEFPDIGLTVEKRNNRMVMFPGSLNHAATPVSMQSNYPPFSGFGRYSMAQFLNIR
jgi:Rps23 Pro-64 3,4-dihydroxylase Tpa1-like proline 4-hydroxylase